MQTPLGPPQASGTLNDGCLRVPLRHSALASVSTFPSVSQAPSIPPEGQSESIETEPHAEIKLHASLINAIGSAYTSSGYPTVVSTDGGAGTIHAAFVDLQSSGVSSTNFPPAQTIIVEPSGLTSARPSRDGAQVVMDTLLRVLWRRGSASFAPANAVAHGKPCNVAPASSHTAATGAPSTGATKQGVGTPTRPVQPGNHLHQHLQQFPDGIHGVLSSPHLRSLLLNGALDETVGEDDPTIAPTNRPPPPLPSTGRAPVLHSLVAVNTFNHFSTYFTAHEEGRVLYCAPLQTLSASIAGRKITAHNIFFLGQEEAHPAPEMGSTTASGGAQTLPQAAHASERRVIPVVDTPVTEAQRALFFGPDSPTFRGADAARGTVSVATVGLELQPYLLLGNQNGDLFAFSILDGAIVHRVNTKSGELATGAASSVCSGGCRGGKVVASPVSTIAEIQSGVERHISTLVDAAIVAKRNGKSHILSSDVGTAAHLHYVALPPSIFAAGFDNGHILLFCVTVEESWMLRHIQQPQFGSWPIRSMSLRIPSFFVRLWASYSVTGGETGFARQEETPIPASQGGSSGNPIASRAALVNAESTLLVPNEEQHMLAIACGSGAVALMSLPQFEILHMLSVYDYNAVGSILSLSWTTSSPTLLVTPDLLMASAEDDSVTAFQVDHASDSSGRYSGTFSSDVRLRVLEKRTFHSSWVRHLSVLPLVGPASGYGSPPSYMGTMLVATSYDRTTSFWPILFSNIAAPAGASSQLHRADSSADGGHLAALHTGRSSGDSSGPFHGGSTGGYVLVDGPTVVLSLHAETVTCTCAVGGGASFLLVSVCCRGRVKFWGVQVDAGGN